MRSFAVGDVVHGVLGVAAAEGAEEDVAVVGFDEGVGGLIAGGGDVGGEVAEGANFEVVDAFEGGDVGEFAAGIESPVVAAVGVEGVEDGAVFELESGEGFPEGDVSAGGAVVESAGGCGVDEEAIGPGWAGHGGKPVVAEGEFFGEGGHDGELFGLVALHDFGGGGGLCLCEVVACEAAAIDRGIGIARGVFCGAAAELLNNVGELMRRVQGHDEIGG